MNDSNEQFSNKLDILVILFVFHIEISGNVFKDEHEWNMISIEVIFFVSHFEISGNVFKDEMEDFKKCHFNFARKKL